MHACIPASDGFDNHYDRSNHGGHHEDVKVKRRKLLDSSVVNGCRQGADDAYYSDASGLQSSDVSGINKIIPSDGAVSFPSQTDLPCRE